MKRMANKTANMQKGTEKKYARPDRPADEAVKNTSIENRLPVQVGHAIGMVHRLARLSPT